MSFLLDELAIPPPEDEKEFLSIQSETYSVKFRLPRAEDLISIPREMDTSIARSYLLSRCIVSAEQNGTEIESAGLPENVQEEIEQRMGEADAAANIHLDLSCPACGHRWDASFDIAVFLWHELHSWAVRLLREVHQLASAYGWREADILSLSAARRVFYLSLINQ